MYVNRTAKISLTKKIFELLQIRIFLTDVVIMTSQFVAMTTIVTYVQFHYTINL